MAEQCAITGIILAGGLARRMGDAARGDKAMLQLGGKSILSRVIERATPQTRHLAINANGPPERFSEHALPVVADPVDGFAGPLAGVLAGLEWAREHTPECEWIVTLACDTPFFPQDLVPRLAAETLGGDFDMACAASNGRHHPVFGLWPVRLAGDLRYALVEEEVRKVDIWTARYRLAAVTFSSEPFDPFFNVNRPQDLDQAEVMAKEMTTLVAT
jgi:molybdopterin-guanine dinucleotide biosynthesis protein A